MQAIRAFNKDVSIVAGGPHPTIDYETVLNENDINAVVIGEGEITFSEILSKMIDAGIPYPLLSADLLGAIKGIAYRKK